MAAIRAWEEHSKATGSTYVVGKQLAQWAEIDTSLCWAENPRLARACRLAVRQVQRALRSLELAGEIVRQPPQPGRRRLFLIDPQHAAQLPLFADRGDTVSPPGGDSLSLNRDIQGRACMKETKGRTAPPLTPPRGNSRPIQTSTVGHRSTRRRRRDQAVVVPDPCVRESITADAFEELRQHWIRLSISLRAAIGDTRFAVWMGGAHLHDVDPLTIAMGPAQISWVAGRYDRLITEVAQGPVNYVACATVLDPAGVLIDA